MDAERACMQLYEDLCAYSMRKDAAGLDSVLAKDYVLVHMTGMRQAKWKYIDAVMDGTLNYYRSHHDSVEVRVSPDGTSATICGRSRVEAAVFGGGRHTWRLQQDLRAELRGDTWLLVESHASTY